MTKFWQTFWSKYGPVHAVNDEDLFMQVGQTLNKRPISKEVFNRTVDYIFERLKLSAGDHVVDLCCGNGLISYELAMRIAYVTGIDFVPRNIRTAIAWKSAKNINYIIGDVMEPISVLIGENIFPGKYLMNISLAYFEPVELDIILSNIIRHMGSDLPFCFLLSGIPRLDLKWNFYDTPERVSRHLENEKQRKNTNDGLGRWWRAEEIEDICFRHGLQVQVTNQPLDISNYRMDALIKSPS
jgi:SAM-dependent methyltransferase